MRALGRSARHHVRQRRSKTVLPPVAVHRWRGLVEHLDGEPAARLWPARRRVRQP
jgi:hypothetical protein